MNDEMRLVFGVVAAAVDRHKQPGSRKQIAGVAGLRESVVGHCLRELQKDGWLAWDANPQGMGPNIYRVLAYPPDYTPPSYELLPEPEDARTMRELAEFNRELGERVLGGESPETIAAGMTPPWAERECFVLGPLKEDAKDPFDREHIAVPFKPGIPLGTVYNGVKHHPLKAVRDYVRLNWREYQRPPASPVSKFIRNFGKGR